MQLNSGNYIQQWGFWRETGIKLHNRMTLITKSITTQFVIFVFVV